MNALKLKTWQRLGIVNIASVISYRLLKRAGWYRYRLPIASLPEGPFFSDRVSKTESPCYLTYFSHHKIWVDSPPDWFVNPWTGGRCAETGRHWSEFADFTVELGDIKTIWEASRFDWLPRLAWAYHEGDRSALGLLELWLRDWACRNPVNGGINWKCGQEASLRCLNLLVGALFIDTAFDSPRESLLLFLQQHLQRISATLRYALAQENNHGISEAAALFLVGNYLSLHGDAGLQRGGYRWKRLGRHWLQNRVRALIMDDGSFSQNSVNYHRMMLDVLSLVELLRVRWGDRSFDDVFYMRCRAAVTWLWNMTDDTAGDAPNLGANDGTCLFNPAGTGYRDFRPSIQLSAAVFLQQSAWTEQVTHPLLSILKINISQFQPVEARKSVLMPDGGYACLRKGDSFAMLRLPVYRFRPSHADALHLDLWHRGINWVRDAGTYSYNADEKCLAYFPGTASHSTVCFDDRDQMPRLGRFLFGAWLQPDVMDWDSLKGFVRSGYTDYAGVCHTRTLKSRGNGWQVEDEFTGFEKEAVIRWHLAPTAWTLEGTTLRCDQMRLSVESDDPFSLSLTELPESRFYLEQHFVPVLEVKCCGQGIVKTVFTFLQS